MAVQAVTGRVLTESLARALAVEAAADGADVVGVRATPRWQGPDTLDTDVGDVRVQPCPSVLAVHAALADRASHARLLMVITDRDDLDAETRAALWRGELVRPYGWDACKRLFRVDRIDARLADHRWLIDLLVDVAPPRGYPPPPSGVLDADTAWQTFLRHGLRLDVERPGLADLLGWAAGERSAAALARFDDETRSRITDRLAAHIGPGAVPVLALAADGRGKDALPLGLVCDTLWASDAAGEAAVAARARLDERLGEIDLYDRTARDWGRAAVEAVQATIRADQAAAASSLLATAEQHLVKLKADGLAASSTVLPAGFTARLAAAGRALDRALDAGELDQATLAALAAVREHLQGEQGHAEADRLEHAARLIRWMSGGGRDANGQDGAGSGDDLAARSRRYVTETSWVDTARAALADGSTVDDLGGAYGRILDSVDASRNAENRAFARALADWAQVEQLGDGPLLPIERVLDRVAVPLASQAPLLVLVVDGLAHAQSHRLLDDLDRRGWQLQEPEADRWDAVVAALPTVTAASRTSLLSGRLTAGAQADERAAFTGHAGLREAAGGDPVLFHKGDLGAQDGNIAPAVRDAVIDRDRRVVGVVVNGADDHLDKGGQIRPMDGLDGVKPLGWLLDAAAEAGRVVLLASDHGHILERDSVRVEPSEGGGERWCPASRDPRADEVRVEGPRVLLGDGAVLVPSVEGIRYIPGKKHGYHGGLTAQEALCPLAVVAPANVRLDGWAATAPAEPAWWRIPPRITVSHEPPTLEVAPPTRTLAPSGELDAAPTLFPDSDDESVTDAEAGDADVGSRATWVEALLASPVLAEQRRLAGRRSLDDRDLAALLGVLDAHGDVVSRGTLARATGLPTSRLTGKLEALRSLLNVEGYPVVSLERDGAVRLNRSLLATQFDLDGVA